MVSAFVVGGAPDNLDTILDFRAIWDGLLGESGSSRLLSGGAYCFDVALLPVRPGLFRMRPGEANRLVLFAV